MRRMTAVVAMVARYRIYAKHVLTKDSAVTGVRSCASIVLVFLGSVCSAVAMGGGRPLSSLDELPSMTVLTTSLWIMLIADL